MENKKNKLLITILIIIIIALCITIGYFMIDKFIDEDNKTNTNNSEVEQKYSKYAMTGNDLQDFDISFLQLESGNKNIIYSPLSIKYALEMLSEGASGNTKTQIDNLIGKYESKKYINNSNMSFANAMFIRDEFKSFVKSEYIDNLKNKYNAEVIYDTFENANNINKWVSDKTFNLVKNLVDDVKQEDYFLINALAIDMEWNKRLQMVSSDPYQNYYDIQYKHEKYSVNIPIIGDGKFGTVKFNNNTIDAQAAEIGASINKYDIVNVLGEENIRNTITAEYNEWVKSVNCTDCEDTTTFVNKFIQELDSNYKQIASSTDFRFYTDDKVKVFAKELKEYNGTTLEYIGIMPIQESLEDYIKDATAANLNKTINNLKTVSLENFEEGKVTKIIGGIPFFNSEYTLDLINDLKKLGVTDVFSDNADLSGIVDNSSVITSASHKATIEFSNDGIKAAAATIEGGMGDATWGFEHLYDVPVVVIDLTFDNPYLYIIRDKSTGEVWFTGTVYEPTVNDNDQANIINEK